MAGIAVVAGSLFATIGLGVAQSRAATDPASTTTANATIALRPAVIAPDVPLAEMPWAVRLEFSPSPALPEVDAEPLLIERLLPALPEAPVDQESPTAASIDLATDGLAAQADPGSLSAHAEMVATFMRNNFDVSAIGGYRPVSSPYDDLTHGHSTGKALDLMVGTTPDGITAGDKIAGFLQANARQLKVRYVIWNQQIWSEGRADEGWRNMPDRGSDTQNHKDHVHVSFQ